MASPVFDSTFGTVTFNSGNNISSFNAARIQQSAGSNEVYIAVVSYYQSSGSVGVSSITESSSTLTFTKQFSFQNTDKSGNLDTIEVWMASATGAFNSGGSSLTWTVNFGGTVGGAVVTIFAASGCASLTLPFDPNVSLPSFANVGNATPPTDTFSTTNADDLLIATSLYTSGSSGSSTPATWTSINNFFNSAPLNDVIGGVYYKSVSSTQSAATFADGSSASGNWVEMVFALTADAGGGGGGNPSKASAVYVGF